MAQCDGAVSIGRPYGKPPVTAAPEDMDRPLFCFRHLSEKSVSDTRDYKFLSGFLLRLKKLSVLGWDGIRKSGRHQYGMEKIPRENIKVALPPMVTDDVRFLDVFRAYGDNRVFIGLQERNVFHVFFIETTFGDFYDHH